MATVRELVAKLGLDFDAQSFLKAKIAFEVLHKAAEFVKEKLEEVGEAFEHAIIGTAEHAHETELLSQQLGVGTTELQRLQYAAGQAGVDSQQLAQGMGILARQVFEATHGSFEAGKKIAEAGAHIYDAAGKVRPLNAIMGDIADKFQKMPDGTLKTGLALEVFSRAGKSLIPLLNKGSKGIKDFGDEAEQLGVVMDKDTIEAGVELTQTLKALKAAGEALYISFGSQLLKPVGELAKKFLEWKKANAEIVKQRLALLAKTLIAVFTGLWKTLDFVIKNFRLLVTIIGSALIPLLFANIAQVASLVSWYIALGIQAAASGIAAAAAWLAAAAPLIALAAIIALIALAAEDVYGYLNGEDSLIGDIGPKWTKLLDDFSKPNSKDPWWLAALRSAAWFVGDLSTTFPRAIAEMQEGFASFFSWIVENAVRVGQVMLSALTGGIYKGDAATAKTAGALAYRFANAGGLTNPFAGAAAVGEAFGGGASPAATAASAPKVGAGTVLAPTTSITINAAPGQSEHEIGNAVRQQMDDYTQKLLQEAGVATGS